MVEDEELDEIFEEDEEAFNLSGKSLDHPEALEPPPPPPPPASDEMLIKSPCKKQQHGVQLRRAVNKLGAMRRRASTVASSVGAVQLNSLLEDQQNRISPFEKSMSSRNLMEQPSTSRRRSLSTGTSWRSKSTSTLVSHGDSERTLSFRHSLASREKSWTSRSEHFKHEPMDNVSESMELISEGDPSTSYTNTSSSLKNGDKSD